MNSGRHHESYDPSYNDLGFPGSYVDHSPLDGYQYDPTYQPIPADPVTMPPTQYVTAWGIRGGLGQTPVTLLPVSSSIHPTPPCASGNGYSLTGARLIEVYPAQSKVSPITPSAAEALA